MNQSEILKTEFCEDFVQGMRNRMLVSFYKYGAAKDNYTIPAGGRKPLVDWKESFEKRFAKYDDTGNLEYLIDLANFAMIEFMHPQHPNAHYDDLSESPGIAGTSIQEIKDWRK